MKLLPGSYIFYIIFLAPINAIFAQGFITKDIKSFGAKGDGKTNDHNAFEKAATYFNSRGGNGKLTISPGIYIVGKQNFTGGQANKPAFEGEGVLHFTNLKNFKINGTANTILKYKDSLRFGAFNPTTGMAYEHGNNLFVNFSYAAYAGTCIFFDNCSNVSVSNLTLDGNNKALTLGGIYGDVGRQVPHYGIFIQNSKNIIVDKINAHHFGLDGISVSNKVSQQKDSISILNSSFQYNARQGLSWIGGNDLLVKNCKFNHTGKGVFSSAPSAGLDIEAEVGPIRNGIFMNCEFINNAGMGIVADTGDSDDCTFTNCTFWGTSTWSIWVAKPGFTFTDCKIYGSVVHGFNSPDDKNATKFIRCNFEDKPYQGKDPYGTYLVESNGARRMSFSDCKFIANNKKLIWITNAAVTHEEKYQFTNCSFTIKNASYPQGDFVAIIRGVEIKNCTFDFKHPDAKKKGLWLGGYNEKSNIDLGGNKIIYSSEK